MNVQEEWAARFEQPLRKVAQLEECEARPMTLWPVTKDGDPFQVHLYSSFIVPDSEEDPEPIIQYHLNTVADKLQQEIDKFDIAEFYPLSALFNNGALQFLFNEDRGVPTRATVCYDVICQGNRISVDVLLKQVGNWYYPIIGGPMDGLLFPFKHVPYEGQKTTFQFDMNPTRDYTIYGEYEDDEDVQWPGLDMQIVYRQRATMHNYQFQMPYVYYMGETIS